MADIKDGSMKQSLLANGDHNSNANGANVYKNGYNKADHPHYPNNGASIDGISWDTLPTGTCRRCCTPVRYAW
jgi:hypothetical protein